MALALACLLALGSARADAKQVYADTASFGEFSYPVGIAVDDATGNILVSDANTSLIDVFSPAGVLLGTFGTGEVSAPTAIAVDQSTHAVYVSDFGNSRIVRYTSDGLPKPTYTLDLTFTSPPPGKDPSSGQIGNFFAASLAVDPTSGDLLVGDQANKAVERFTSGGVFVSAFDGAGSEVALQAPLAVTADGSGEIYVLDYLGAGIARVARFGPTGVAQGPLGAPGALAPTALTYDAGSDDVVVATAYASALAFFHEGRQEPELPFEGSHVTTYAIAAAGDGSGRVYALSGGVHVLAPVTLPDVTLGSTSALTTSSAHLSGTVDPLGVKGTEYHFEYSSDGSNWTSAPAHEAGGGNAPVAAEEDLSGLEPHRAYQVRLVATNPGGQNVSETGSFTTLVALPTVVTGDATDITAGEATLRGTVDAQGAQGSFRFEYGPTAAYGSSAPSDYELPAGEERVARGYTRAISGLAPNSTYHYRIVAKNSAGTSYGADRTFTTAAGSGEASAYELVTPVDKSGNQVNIYTGYMANFDGSALSYLTQTAFDGYGTESAPFYTRYVARRTPGVGWSSNATDPPQESWSNVMIAVTLAVSEDGTKAVVISPRALAPGAVEEASNTYLRDVATGAYTLIATVPGLDYYYNQRTYDYGLGVNANEFVYGTSDFSHVLLYGQVPLLAGAPAEANYDFTGGQLRLVSVAPNGTPLRGGSHLGREDRDQHLVSEDGSKIFFTGEGAVYVRLDDSSTEAISVSHRAKDAGTVQPATWLGASSDGRLAFIVSHDLTEDSEPGVTSLYRYDSETHALDMLAALPDGIWKMLQVSANGASVYFESGDVLAAGGVAGSPNTYVWRGGHVSLVATSDATRGSSGVYEWQSSPDGRYFVFADLGQFTEYDNSSTACPYEGNMPTTGTACSEVYRYDADTGTIVCASCRRDGARPTGNALLGYFVQENAGHHFPRVVFDDGRVYFETVDQLATRDVNSKRDVYSFDGAQASLVSPGQGGPAYLADVSGDERNVFFVTGDKLVSSDTDKLLDVYDLRVGGGIAAQNPAPARPECSGESCLGAGLAPAGPPSAASIVFDGPGNVVADAETVAKSKPKPSRTVRGPVFTLRVKAARKGRITVSGADVASVAKVVGKPGSYALRVELTAGARRLLKQKRSLALRLRVRVVYAGGKSSAAVVPVTVKA